MVGGVQRMEEAQRTEAEDLKADTVVTGRSSGGGARGIHRWLAVPLSVNL